eukprot:9503893-Pyramimonas_sp.AAC.4
MNDGGRRGYEERLVTGVVGGLWHAGWQSSDVARFGRQASVPARERAIRCLRQRVLQYPHIWRNDPGLRHNGRCFDLWTLRAGAHQSRTAVVPFLLVLATYPAPVAEVAASV